MPGPRSEGEGGSASPSPKQKIQNVLLKISTANAFALKATGAVAPPSPLATVGRCGSLFFADDQGQEPSPPGENPVGPYFGAYAEYDSVMELLHGGIMADGGARGMLAHVEPTQIAHVAHLGLGACCTVDLVAVHCAGGVRVLAACKSCYLPPSDPRLRALLREAELLRRCGDCPFIMQLLGAVQEAHARGPAPPAAWGAEAGAGGDAWGSLVMPPGGGSGGGGGGGGWGGSGSISPVHSPRSSLHLAGRPSGDVYGGGGGGAEPHHRRSGGSSTGGMAPAGAPPAATSSPAYQAWAQWRGGGAAEDLDRQMRQRLAAAAATSAPLSRGGSGALSPRQHGPQPSPSSLSGMAPGLGGAAGLRVGSVSYGGAGSGGGSLSPQGYGSGASFSLPGSGFGSPYSTLHDGASSYGGGGGWADGGGGGGGAHSPSYNGGGRPPRRRASLEVIDMYSGCAGMAGGAQGARGSGSGYSEPLEWCRLLIGWARCGDLRRLVQLLLGRSPAHQPRQATGEHPPVAGLPLLMPEEAARFYTGCLALALEHLHDRLHVVHRDLKLANLLLLANGYAIVGDLGTAVDLTTVPGGRLNSRVGSPGHMAPECRDRDEAGYGTAADMWSLGACLYALLTGQLPAGTAGPPSAAWAPATSRHMSPHLASLLTRLLAWSPSQRPTVAQLMRDPWFRGFSWSSLRAQMMPAPQNTPWRELLWWPKEKRP